MRNWLYYGLLLALPALFACTSEEVRMIGRTAESVEGLTKAHTRVVWAQDHSELTDVFGRSDQLRLMGYDSRDGKGERMILPGPRNFLKPLFTPDGDRIVYSVIAENATYIVDWDGDNHRKLTDGMALATWRDPTDHKEWIYIGREVRDERGFSFHRIVRMPLDAMDTEEVVWTQHLVQMDNFQLSADGRRAATLFPWPDSGIAELPDGRMKRVARGCWTAFAPDNSYVMWTFDGSHRNLIMDDTRNETQWNINISQAGGVDGNEVYHPRWSNHPLIMTMSGPYTVRVGGNNIRGGGADVEVYLGRFSEDRRSIEQWVRVTDNPYANFFPDAWIDPGDLTLDTPETAPDVIVGNDDEQTAPNEELLFLWVNRDADNEVTTRDGRRHRSEAVPVGRARYGRHMDMDVRHGYFKAPALDDSILATIREANAFSMECVITPSGPSDSRGALIAWGAQGTDRNLALLAADNDLLIVWKGGRLRVPDCITPKPQHLVLAMNDVEMTLHIDGTEIFVAATPEGLFDTWSAQPLYFGGHPAGSNNWSGYMEGIALYARALPADEVRSKAEEFGRALAQRTPPQTVTVKARLTYASQIPTPEAIEPYQRGLIANEYEVLEILEGHLEDEQILVAHWVILDGQSLDNAQRDVGELYTMTLELYDDRPELEGERLSMDSDNLLLRTFFDTGS